MEAHDQHGDHHDPHDHHDAHASIAHWKQPIIATALALVATIGILVLLTQVVTDVPKQAKDDDAAVLGRLKPVGELVIASASAPKGQLTGEQVFGQVCKNCHETGLAGAPKVGDKAAWGKVIARLSGAEDLLLLGVELGLRQYAGVQELLGLRNFLHFRIAAIRKHKKHVGLLLHLVQHRLESLGGFVDFVIDGHGLISRVWRRVGLVRILIRSHAGNADSNRLAIHEDGDATGDFQQLHFIRAAGNGACQTGLRTLSLPLLAWAAACRR